ncbi:M20 family metallopeptidase, partial [Candidatus Roizmanbacteria bacterium]|nr:M20 family metallopeptidase [Candidatus Roizmanbacteria bacterium]
MSEIENVINLTSSLIKIRSTWSEPDALRATLDLARSELSGFPYEKFESKRDDGIFVPSLLFFNKLERPSSFQVLLHGHLDVVPAQDETQFTPQQTEGRLYGRGSQDMKSGASALITVFRNLAKDLPYPIGLSLTTDEEIGGYHGAGYQVNQGISTNFVISAESSNLQIGNQHKGLIAYSCRSKTSGGHTAYDGNDHNALQKQIGFHHKVNELYPGPDGSWRTTSSIVRMRNPPPHGNIVPSEAFSQIVFRFISEESPEDIRHTIQAIDPKMEITTDAYCVAHYTNPNDPNIL